MGVITFSVSFEGDSDGYFTYECPFCESLFKLKIAEMQDNEKHIVEIFCPYCGLTDTIKRFYTKEVINHAKQVAKNYAIDRINKKSGGIIKLLKKENVPVVTEVDTVEQEFKCSCCKYHVKVLYNAGVSKIFCAYCGVDI
jgi:transcription elongation factor Elf1